MRLAGFDFVTAAAIVGAIDAVRGQDTVMPWLDLSQAVPQAAETDLTDLDFADLIALEVDPAPGPAEFADLDLGELEFEQLLAMQTDAADEPLSALTGVAMEELLRVEVDAAGTAESPAPFDLTGLGLGTLQDLQFGEDEPLPETPYLRLATLDLTRFLDQGTEDLGTLFDRGTTPTPIAIADYVAVQPGRGDTTTGSKPSPDLIVTRDNTPPGGPINQPPEPLNDLLETEQGNALTGNVLANDSDPDGDLLSVANIGKLDTAELGAVEIAADGQFTYAPPGDFHGVDWFTYSVTDSHGEAASAMVSIDVIKANSAPIAADDLFIGTAGITLSGDVLANDHDPDGDTLTVSSTGLLDTERGGMVRMQADGIFEYRPPNAFAGTGSITYSVEDGHGGTASATITFTVGVPGSILNGTGADDRLVGAAGGDTLHGKGGNDLLIGLAGADILAGGAGIDTASYEDSDTGVEVSLASGEGQDGHAEGDTLSGIENLIGSIDADFLQGDAGSNVIQGGAGEDKLMGDAGNDVLMGGFGDDILDGGIGIDALLGEAGADTFVIGPGSGSDLDVIADFNPGEDVIDLTEFGLSGMSDLSIGTDIFGGSMIALPGGDSLSLLLVDPASLSSNDFIF